MENWLAKQAYLEQHIDGLLQEAARERLIRKAMATRPEAPKIPRKEGNPMIKRRLAYLVALVILAALLIAQVVSAAAISGGGGGGRFLYM